MAKSKNQEGIKLTESELSLIGTLGSKKQIVSNESAYLAKQQLAINHRNRVLETLYEETLELEKQISTSFTDKYGEGTINIDTGTFIPA